MPALFFWLTDADTDLSLARSREAFMVLRRSVWANIGGSGNIPYHEKQVMINSVSVEYVDLGNVSRQWNKTLPHTAAILWNLTVKSGKD